MISLSEYLMGRDKQFPAEYTDEIKANALITITRVNLLLNAIAHDFNVDFTKVVSGWRPIEINDATSNASKTSKHIIGLACDLYDPEHKLCCWCLSHLAVLENIGLWMEHPSYTRSWLHIQCVAPGSGRRVFVP